MIPIQVRSVKPPKFTLAIQAFLLNCFDVLLVFELVRAFPSRVVLFLTFHCVFFTGLAFDSWDLDYYTSMFQKFKRNPTSVECFDLAQSNR